MSAIDGRERSEKQVVRPTGSPVISQRIRQAVSTAELAVPNAAWVVSSPRCATSSATVHAGETSNIAVSETHSSGTPSAAVSSFRNFMSAIDGRERSEKHVLRPTGSPVISQRIRQAVSTAELAVPTAAWVVCSSATLSSGRERGIRIIPQLGNSVARLKTATVERPAATRMWFAASNPETTASSCSVSPAVHAPQNCVRL